MTFGEEFIFTTRLSSWERQQVSHRYLAGRLVKLACGIYYPRGSFERLRPGEQALIRSLALGISGKTLVGKSAAAMWHLPEVDLYHYVPEVRGRQYCTNPGVIARHVTALGTTEYEWNGYPMRLTSPALTVVDIARWHGLARGVCEGESFVRRKFTDAVELERALALRTHCTGEKVACEAVGLIDGGSESYREAEVKVRLYQLGFGGFYQQAEIYSADMVWVARVDFFFPDQSVVVEYDGKGKTHGEFNVDAITAVNDERDRERRLVSLGIRVVRITAKSFRTEEWVENLQAALKQNEGHVYPSEFWRKQD
ncbi:hypothetical protein [Corynebacterium pyruviciproducens]|uniref:hypothetical protein n=1 Tax=Corynebacterium pyruviciproducens TaxID=598660 RepID=UPI00254F0314|nr:hypothetical protein [Corynebacterium pyruviciproducens]MDK7215267.1 hypothetical protein [Corynebacterium pyruviciproducens]